VDIWCVFFDESKVEIEYGVSNDRVSHHFTEVHGKIQVSRPVCFRVFSEAFKANLFVKNKLKI
jgi:hypothetical protein